MIQRAWVRAFGRRAASPVAASSRASPNQPSEGHSNGCRDSRGNSGDESVTLLFLQTTLPAPDLILLSVLPGRGGFGEVCSDTTHTVPAPVLGAWRGARTDTHSTAAGIRGN